MYGIFTYIYHKNQPNVGKYTIHGWYGLWSVILAKAFSQQEYVADSKVSWNQNLMDPWTQEMMVQMMIGI